MTSIQEASAASGIPLEQLEALLAIPYKEGTCLPKPMTLASLGFARGVISDIRAELDLKLKQSRRERVSRILCKRRLITAEAFFPQTE